MTTSNAPKTKPEKILYTVPEVMEVLQISRAQVYRMTNSGKLRRIKMGGLTRFKVSEVHEYIEKLAA